MSVFKFPWEKGRLAKIFSDQPLVPVKVPKLQPGPRSLLQMSLQVGQDGSVSAKPIFKSSVDSSDRPTFLDVVKSVADFSEPVDKEAKAHPSFEGVVDSFVTLLDS